MISTRKNTAHINTFLTRSSDSRTIGLFIGIVFAKKKPNVKRPLRNAGASGLVELRSRLEEEEEEHPGPAPGGSFSALQPSMLPGDLALEREREDPHGQQDYRCFFIPNLFSMIYRPLRSQSGEVQGRDSNPGRAV